MLLGFVIQQSKDKEKSKSPSNTNEDGKEESNEADYDEKPREINHTTTITTNGVF